jgi:L,D-peptidoglycan transpeptidase YkuD (ErfK/YbiS/YcfS/YnhG family)
MLTTIEVRRKPGETARGVLIADGRTLPCALGRSGPSVFKREGDGATPAHAVMRPLWGLFRADRGLRPASKLALAPIAADQGWCDAPEHPSYNAPVRLPFAASHEVMRRADCLYDICIVLDWNMAPRGRARHRGSAILLHMAKPGFPPTAGCIALRRRDLEWLVARIDRNTRIVVAR